MKELSSHRSNSKNSSIPMESTTNWWVITGEENLSWPSDQIVSILSSRYLLPRLLSHRQCYLDHHHCALVWCWNYQALLLPHDYRLDYFGHHLALKRTDQSWHCHPRIVRRRADVSHLHGVRQINSQKKQQSALWSMLGLHWRPSNAHEIDRRLRWKEQLHCIQTVYPWHLYLELFTYHNHPSVWKSVSLIVHHYQLIFIFPIESMWWSEWHKRQEWLLVLLIC